MIKDGDSAGFGRDVIEASDTGPVLVEFRAAWSGPSRQLTPVLEKLVRAAGGRVRLVRIDADRNPELVRQLRVPSLPTVHAFLRGRSIESFQGVPAESRLEALIGRLVAAAGPADTAGGAGLAAARAALEGGDAEGAVALFREILAGDPADAAAIAGLARALLELGRAAEARQLLDGTQGAQAGNAGIAAARAALGMVEEGERLGVVPALEAQLQQDAQDHDARYRLATLLFLRGRVEPAIDHLLEILRHDLAWRDDRARGQLLKLLDAIGPTHPAFVAGRRRLSSLMFA